MSQTRQFNVRLSAKTLDLIVALAAALECSQADVVRQAARLLARRHEITPPKPPEKKSKKSPDPP